MAGAAPDSGITQIYQERNYPQFDCVGSYLWIWERLIPAGGGAEVVARQVHHHRPPAGERDADESR